MPPDPRRASARCLRVLAAGLCAIILGAAEPAAGVAVADDLLTLPLIDRIPNWELGSLRGNSFFPGPSGDRTGAIALRRLTLANRWLRVEILPEVGGAVARAVHLPTGFDLFYREDMLKTALPFWESGVKASFPHPEHGIASRGQPAAWRVVRAPDGSATVAMWMEFSRFTGPQQRAQFGRYSAMLLGQYVTLRPDRALVEVRYRLVNPCPYRLGRRLWNDAIFPRRHGVDGAVMGLAGSPAPDDARWIYPVAWASDHRGADLRRIAPGMLDLAALDRPALSLFAWDRRHGFDGLHYPAVDVCRLRLSDPREAPGAKLWWPRRDPAGLAAPVAAATENIAELWGGFDDIFEGVGAWLEPGEHAEFTHAFGLTAGIGAVVHADRVAALGRRGDRLAALAWSDHPAATLRVPGVGAVAGSCGPATPLAIDLPAGWTGGEAILAAGDAELLRVGLPLAVPEGTERHAAIRSHVEGPLTPERTGHPQNRGLNWSAALVRAPSPSPSRCRLLLIAGRLEECIAEADRLIAADPAAGEAWHLGGCALLELGRREEAATRLAAALAAGDPFPAAGYQLALCALAAGRPEAAAAHLDALVAGRPQHGEARLLRAWIAVVQREAAAGALVAALDADDPADPRRAWVRFLHRGAPDRQEVLARLLEEPGAASRLAEFQAATRGQLRHPARPVSW